MDAERGSRSEAIRRIARAAIRTDEELGAGVVSSGLLLAFFVIFIPVGIVTFIATAVVTAFVWAALGGPTGTVAAILGVAWFGGTLALLLVVFAKLYRRLPRRMRAAVTDPAAIVGSDPAATDPGTGSSAPRPPAASLAELDARLAPPPGGDAGSG